MSYIDSGFDNNLIRKGYAGEEDTTYDDVNSGEILAGGSIPISEVTGDLVAAGVLNSSNQVIKDIVNANLDTQAKEILGEFVFSGSGAIAIATDTDNGIWLSPTGILAKKSGANTIALETDGDATFGGNLVAAFGTIGALSLATGGNIKMGKTAFTDDTNSGFWLGDVGGVAKFKMGSSALKYFSYDGTDLTMVGGNITGSVITGGTIQSGGATGSNIKISGADNELQFLYNNSKKAYMLALSDGKLFIDCDASMGITANDAIIFTFNDKGGSDGLVVYNNRSIHSSFDDDMDFSNWAGDIYCHAGDVIANSGYLKGQHKSSDGSAGRSFSHDFITSIYWDGSTLKARRRTYTFKDGLCTNYSSETTFTP